MTTEILAAHQIGVPILSLILFIPFAAALFVWAVQHDLAARWITCAAMLSVLALSLVVWHQFERGTASFQFAERSEWIGPLGIGYHIAVDGISLLFVILTALLALFMLISSWQTVTHSVRNYLICLLLLETTTLGVFVSLDLILFFFFWEVMLIPIFFLIKVWGQGERDYTALKYLLYTLAGSVLMLVAITILHLNHRAYAEAHGLAQTASFDFLHFLQTPLSPSLQLWVFVFFFFGFAVKGPILPFHTWMPSVLVHSPVAVGVALAGIKLGTYGFLRFSLPLAPVASQQLSWLVMTLALIGVIYGAVIALMQHDLRRLIAYSSISHLGLVAVGLFALNFRGLQGGLLHMLSLGVSTGAFFFFIGYLEQRRCSTRLEDLGGVVKEMPILATFLFIILLSMLGLPSTNLFVSEFLILLGAFEAHWSYALIGVLGIILGAAYLLWWFERAMFGPAPTASPAPSGNPPTTDLTRQELAVAVPLVALIFWIGLYPAPFLRVINPSISAVVERLQSQPTIVKQTGPAAPADGQIDAELTSASTSSESSRQGEATRL